MTIGGGEPAQLPHLVAESQRLAKAGDWGEDAFRVNLELARLQPEARGVVLRLSHCLKAKGRVADAERGYQRVLDLAPQARDLPARVAQRELRRLSAEREAKTAASSGGALQRALELRTQARTDEALIWHERAVELGRTQGERCIALGSWASTLRGLRRFAEALALVEKALRLDPSRQTNKGAYACYIAILVDTDRLRDAIDEAERLVAAHPHDPVVLAAAGRAHAASSQGESYAIPNRRRRGVRR